MTRLFPRPRVAARIARTEMRRDVRAILNNPTQVAALGIVAMFGFAFVLAGVFGAYALGSALRSGGDLADAPVLPAARGVGGLLWLGLTGFVTARTVGQSADLDAESGILTTVPVADVVAGLVLTDLAWVCLSLGPIALLAIGAFAVGAKAPMSLVVAPAVGLAVVASALPLGFGLGTAVRHLITRYEPLARRKTAIGVTLFLGWMGLALSGQINHVVVALYGPVRASPLGWLGDAVLIGVPNVAPSPVRGTVALFGAAAVAVGGLAISSRAATRHWLSDPPQSDTEAAVADGDSLVDRLLAGVVSRPTRSVTTAVWLRARRAPIQLVFVLYPLFAAGIVVQDVLEKGFVPVYAPPSLAVYVAWAVGAGFTLNVLGTQGSALPAVLSSGIDGRSFVRGHLLASAVVGSPLAAVLVGGLALASPIGIPAALGLAAVTALGSVVAAALATGFGVAFPRFGTVNITSNREATVPSKTAAAFYSVAWLLVAVLGAPLLSPWAAREVAGWLDTSVVVVAGGFVVGLLVVLSVPYLSYRYAVRSVDRYYLD